MQAVIKSGSGKNGMLKVMEVEKPQPREDEVLVEVIAATVIRGDVILNNMHPLLMLPMRLFGLKKKTVPGHEFAGVVQAVGEKVSRFRASDRVFGTTTGLKVGSQAEFVCLPEEWGQGFIEKMPDNVGFAEAAATPVGGMTAVYILRKGEIKKGQKVLIYGASGSVGTFAVQLAKYFGAEVTGVCSTRNLELVKSLGADHLIDYTRQDLSKISGPYDVIFDAVGKTSLSDWKQSLNHNGKFLTVQSPTKESHENLNFLKTLLEAGKIRPVVDKTFPLEKIAEAYEYVQTGHKRGNVVIQIGRSHGNS